MRTHLLHSNPICSSVGIRACKAPVPSSQKHGAKRRPTHRYSHQTHQPAAQSGASDSAEPLATGKPDGSARRHGIQSAAALSQSSTNSRSSHPPDAPPQPPCSAVPTTPQLSRPPGSACLISPETPHRAACRCRSRCRRPGPGGREGKQPAFAHDADRRAASHRGQRRP